jgi:hypothetical protein
MESLGSASASVTGRKTNYPTACDVVIGSAVRNADLRTSDRENLIDRTSLGSCLP